ncbi:hypothetical protein P4O66_015240, partial [Electrophorus voltai]
MSAPRACVRLQALNHGLRLRCELAVVSMMQAVLIMLLAVPNPSAIRRPGIPHQWHPAAQLDTGETGGMKCVWAHAKLNRKKGKQRQRDVAREFQKVLPMEKTPEVEGQRLNCTRKMSVTSGSYSAGCLQESHELCTVVCQNECAGFHGKHEFQHSEQGFRLGSQQEQSASGDRHAKARHGQSLMAAARAQDVPFSCPQVQFRRETSVQMSRLSMARFHIGQLNHFW